VIFARAHLYFSAEAEHCMSMPAVHRFWTAAEVRRLIEEQPLATPRLELVDGELLVTPSPTRMHQRIVFALAKQLDAYVTEQQLGELCISPSDVELRAETIVQPDVYVVPAEDGRRPRAVFPVRSAMLAVEVLSPSSARYDRVMKRRLYQSAVPEYWVVDADAGVFERWRPGESRPEIIDADFSWSPEGSTRALSIDVREFFAQVGDPD
jgi:Uma2 family endonuclease